LLFPDTLLSGILGYFSPIWVVITWKTKNEMHIRDMVCVNVACVEVAQYSIFVGCILLHNVHVRISQTYSLPEIATESFLLMLLYLLVSQHVSAPTGHHLVGV
jgi:hypothetical protein